MTLVLYFGHKQRWSGPLTLKERLDIPKELDKYVNDYEIHVFEIAFMDQKEVDLFQSDFRVVADYFVQKRRMETMSRACRIWRTCRKRYSCLVS